MAWIGHEAKALGIRHGWICGLRGIVPGIAVGFALYLLLRMKQLGETGGVTVRTGVPADLRTPRTAFRRATGLVLLLILDG